MTTAECMKRFFTEKIRDNHDAWRAFIVSFMACNNADFKRWFQKEGNMAGVTILRFRVLLELAGYCPSELADLKPELQFLARLVAFRIVTPDKLVAVAGLADGWNALLKALMGKRAIGQGRLAKLTEFASACQPKLTKETAEWLSKVPNSDSVTQVAVPLAPSLKSANRIVTPEAVQPKTDRLEILWKALGPLAEILAPQSVKIGEIYARYQRRLSEDGSELPELTPENFTKQELSPAELAKLVEHTKWALTQARGCLAVLAQVAKGDLRQESLQAIRLEATELWHTYQVAKALIPEEILTEIWMSSAFSARGSEPVKKGKTNDQDRK